MLKKALIIVGALGALAMASTTPAAAYTHHGMRTRHGQSVRHVTWRFHRTRHVARAWHHHERSRHFAHLRHRFGHGIRSASAAETIRSDVGPVAAYRPASTAGSTVQTGRASYYSGGRTASGGVVGAATCAHRWLPFGTRILVTNLRNLRQTVLTVNDRGPFVRGRVLDVSRVAASTLGMIGSGVAQIRLQVVGGPG